MSRKHLTIAGFVALALVVIVSVLGWRFLSAAGYFTGIRQEIAATCRAIPAVPGPEDIQIDHERKLAFISGYDRRAVSAGAPGSDAIRGGIYVIDLSEPQEDWSLRPVTPNVPARFRPHGISLYKDENGVNRLFAVNHPAGGPETVEIFDIEEDGTLTHVHSVTSDAFISLNDVVAVGPESFYATNDHGTRNPLGQLLGDFTLMRNSTIVYFDGEKADVVADKVLYANGINVSEDGRLVYVASALGMSVYIYERDIETGKLLLQGAVRLGTGVDNIDIQPDGTLLIGAHPNIIAFLSHASDPEKHSPSQVVRLEPKEKRAGTIYLNFGEEISGISVAAGYGDVMLLGQVFEPEVLVCSQSRELRSY
ncbi:SMP-30/gluconolactonase/LRE family protein [Parvibaculum sp.]|jgi:arylesterase/paraoxonase|uniref:SMP-30/gluconolactonase/LRE family protein n=1 Tax=Parvibaculum sp. TaxID=2024848 RepID=UPI003C7338D8